MSGVPGGPLRRVIVRAGVWHEVGEWGSNHEDGVNAMLRCGAQVFFAFHRKPGDPYWRDTHNEDDPTTCLWCLAGRRKV
jgi:hypothetical protein